MPFLIFHAVSYKWRRRKQPQSQQQVDAGLLQIKYEANNPREEPVQVEVPRVKCSTLSNRMAGSYWQPLYSGDISCSLEILICVLGGVLLSYLLTHTHPLSR